MQVQSRWQRSKAVFKTGPAYHAGFYRAPGSPRWKSVVQKTARIALLVIYGVVLAPSMIIGFVLSSMLKLTEPSKRAVLRTDRLDSGLDKLINKRYKVERLVIKRGRGELLQLNPQVIDKILKIAPERLELESIEELPNTLLNPAGKNFGFRKAQSKIERIQVLIRKSQQPVYELKGEKFAELKEELKDLIEAEFPIETLKIRSFLTRDEIRRLRPLLDKVNAREIIMVI